MVVRNTTKFRPPADIHRHPPNHPLNHTQPYTHFPSPSPSPPSGEHRHGTHRLTNPPNHTPQVNIDIVSEAEDYSREPEDTLGLIRQDLVGEFKLTDNDDVYLISAKLRDSGRFDLPRLKTDIGASLGSVKQRKVRCV